MKLLNGIEFFICLVLIVGMYLINGEEYCVAVARCLNDVADKMESCNRAFVQIAQLDNVTKCRKEIYDQQLSLAELHQDQARVFANCINGMESEWNFTCPMDVMRFKRQTMTIGDHEKMHHAMLKVVKDCKNGEDVLNNVKTKHDKGQLLTRQDIVEYIKRTCRGNTNLSVADLPGGDAKLEQLYAKVKKECNNGTQIINKLTMKYQNKEIYTRYQAIEFIRNNCHNQSSVTIDDLPSPQDAKFEAATWKVQKNCINYADLIKNLQSMQRKNEIRDSRQIAEYFNKNCHGRGVNLTEAEFGSDSNQNSTNGQNAFMEKLERAYAQVRTKCKNGNKMSKELQQMFEQRKIETSEQIVDFVERHCDGRANLTVNDLPLIGCDVAAKKLLAKCILSMNKCSTAKICQQCLEKSSMSRTILHEKEKLAKIRKMCTDVKA